MSKTKLIICCMILLALTPLISAYSPDWKLELQSQIIIDGNTATGQFIAGAGDPAVDGIDIYDGRMIEAPSYGIPFYTIMGSEYFMVDYRESLSVGVPKTWQITQKGGREFRRTGTLTETITWDTLQVPETVELALFDYGDDLSRAAVVQEIDMLSETSYTFQVTRPYQEYRYLDLKATLSEPTCFENWTCTVWAPDECPEDETQTRTCTDTNNCGTIRSKPAETQSCDYTPPCPEEWICTAWTPAECPEDETQTRVCTDNNDCGTAYNKPAEIQGCDYTSIGGDGAGNDSGDDNRGSTSGGSGGGRGGSTATTCTPEWKCTYWNTCSSDATQIRRCTDENSCNTDEGKPEEEQECTPAVEPVRGNTGPEEPADEPEVEDEVFVVYSEEPKADVLIGIAVMVGIVFIGLSLYFIVAKHMIL